MGTHRRSGEDGRGRPPLAPGPRRRHVQERRLPHRPLGDRELPGQAPGGGQRRRDRRARRDARHLVKAFIVLQPGQQASGELEAELQAHVRQYLAP
ncbi:MAG: hypothetical protein M5R42_07690 [Rhodocyclaceae bacterium]|nr:hypothetical protein [Rhodocyclaceae bacterium]